MGPVTLEYEPQKPLSLEGKLSREDIPTERIQDSRGDVHFSRQSSSKSNTSEAFSRKDVNTDVSENEIREAQLIASLQERVRADDKDAVFEFGQFYFEKRNFEEARTLFEQIENENMQAKYQLAVMFYDGLGVKADHVIIYVLDCF